MSGTAALPEAPVDPLGTSGTPGRGLAGEASGGDSGTTSAAAVQQVHWRMANSLASGLEPVERFIAGAGYDRGPWLAVAFGCGIAAWFIVPGPMQWLGLIAGALGVAVLALGLAPAQGRFPYTRQAVAGVMLTLAAGCGTVWMKSEMAGMPALSRTMAGILVGVVESREEQPADGRTRLILAIRSPDHPDEVVRVRINVPMARDDGRAVAGALVQVRARLMPPGPPMLPGSYDFARAAWFSQLAATGAALGPVTVLKLPPQGAWGLQRLRRLLSGHVRTFLSGSPGGIAAAFASGDRGGITEVDEQAMRDSGLTHLLSVSGLHVSAVIGGTYFLAIRLLALWPWLALRVRLPLLSAGLAAGMGIFYALLTGAEVPTVRSVLGSLLVLGAVAIGRDALSLRLLAVAAFLVMLVWPESVVGPSFQLSFGAVLTIIVVHMSGPMRRLVAHRQEPWWAWALRHLASILITGLAIELALMPITLFHFHRAGIYGSIANVIAIPLTTVITMPLIALGLFMDIVGAGAPAWWAVGKSLEFLLWLAHLVARQPGAVTMLPTMSGAAYALFLGGGLWLALWQKRVRFLGLVPILVGSVWLAMLKPPDILISGDGRHVAFPTLQPDTLVLLRDSKRGSGFARDNLAESAGMDGQVMPLEQWPGARCNPDFCALDLDRGGRTWRVLLSRSANRVPLDDLVQACFEADVVISDRRLPWSCKPRAIKADRDMLDRTGGMTIDLARLTVRTVAENQGDQGWWHPRVRPPRRLYPAAGASAATGDGIPSESDAPSGDTTPPSGGPAAAPATPKDGGAPAQ
jgi:competence protein ComEC